MENVEMMWNTDVEYGNNLNLSDKKCQHDAKYAKGSETHETRNVEVMWHMQKL